MTTRIAEIVSEVLQSKRNLSTITFVLPSKRAGAFLRNEIVKQLGQTVFSPTILSIEEFIENIADLKIGDSTNLLFEFYESYLSNSAIAEKENFESFSSWATVLLDDFNEIDRNLIDRDSFFNYLHSIQELEHWYLKEDKTEIIKNYISFWDSLPSLYADFTERTTQQGMAHQGLVYRKAANIMEVYANASKDKYHIFAGFNALNNAEELIIKELLENNNAEIYWDADGYFMENENHSASLFLRNFRKEWKYFKTNDFKDIGNNYIKGKNISIIGSSKNIGQVKYTAEILAALPEEELEKTAVVLADENLLLPLINSFPANVGNVNITMGVPLKALPALVFFENLLNIHQEGRDNYYYKDILQILNHFLGKILAPESNNRIANEITKNNITQLSFEQILSLTTENEKPVMDLLFRSRGSSVENSIVAIKECLYLLKSKREVKENPILLETLFKVYQVWNKLETLNQKYGHITTPKALTLIFKDLVSTTNLDFKGEPYKGLQIMGILETRALDFENVILVSVNEGILPAGKSNRSFITHDLKKQYKLPTHREKDAIYTYHFYRLLHRASHVWLIYNNHSSGIQVGEKSRFLLQMQYYSPPAHVIKETLVSPKINITSTPLQRIDKTPAIMEELKKIAEKGFSPSALTTYIRNPMDFYTHYILGIRDTEEVEETVAMNTLGTVIHDTLQNLYEPCLGKILTVDLLQEMAKIANAEVTIQFTKTFKEGNIGSGKNLIIFEIAKRFVNSLIKMDILQVEEGNEIQIKVIEDKLKTQIPISELDFPVFLGGKVDRMDIHNGMLRIIDYKSGKVEQKDLNITEWDLLNTDYKFSKIFQVLSYALMSNETLPIHSAQAGIISFKNLKAGFMPFTKKEAPRDKGNSIVNQEILADFTIELQKLILEICNPKIPFIEKEV